MTEKIEGASQEQQTRAVDVVQNTMQTFLETGDVEKVYSGPIQQGDITIIPTAEVLVAAGFGAGYGSGGGDEAREESGGGGGGGGGRTLSRPVAVVVASPRGVRVEPVVDRTKIALAALTAGGFMLTTLMRMVRGGKAD